MSFDKTSLWQSSFASNRYPGEAEARNRLRDQLLDIRKRVELLVSRIPADLREITVHDISHLDALWETASQIAGEKYQLNPAEGFVFGVAVLMHDAAMSMAAYPEGLPAIQRTPEWGDAVASYIQKETGEPASPQLLEKPSEEISRAVLPDVLRELHAKGANRGRCGNRLSRARRHRHG